MLGGMGRFVAKGDRVVIKPNMSFPNPPEFGTNTHPEVVRELLSMCREAGASRVLVLDNPLSRVETCIEQSGIKAACDTVEEGVVHGLESSRFFADADIPQARVMDSNAFMKDVLEADVLISAPTAKSHSGAGVSLSLKNMMGLIRHRGRLHSLGLDDSIVDLNTFLVADLVVIDAHYVLSTRGPFGPGKVLPEKTVIASTDPVAADAMAVSMFEWYGRRFEPAQVGHIKRAAERGLGRIDIENLDVKRVEVG
jgi:uncharacterized protein (DUF362 family)